MFKYFFTFITISFLASQNVELYISLINEGKVDGVKENLPELLSKYPSDLEHTKHVFCIQVMVLIFVAEPRNDKLEFHFIVLMRYKLHVLYSI